MRYLLCGLLLFGLSPICYAEDVQILINPDQLESKIVHSEIVRDWEKYNIKDCQAIQEQLPSIEFVREHIQGVKTPAIRFSKRSSWISYDDRAFYNQTKERKIIHEKLGFALKTTKWMVDCQHIDQMNQEYEQYYGLVIYPPYWKKMLTLAYSVHTKFEKELNRLAFELVFDSDTTTVYQFYQNKWTLADKKEAIECDCKKWVGQQPYEDRVLFWSHRKVIAILPYDYNQYGSREYFNRIELDKPIDVPLEPFPCVYREPPAPWEEPYKWFPSQ